MFWYYLSNNLFLKKYSIPLRILINILRFYFAIIFAIDVCGGLFLQVKNINIADYIDKMSPLTRFFLIHSVWLLVILLIIEIIIVFLAMAENSKENCYRGDNLLQVKQEKWRFIIPNALCFSFGIFAILGTLTFHPAIGISVFLLIFKVLLDPLIHSITLTTDGVLLTKSFGDIFFSYNKLYPYSDKEEKMYLRGSGFSLKFSNTTDETFVIELKCNKKDLESLINLYQQKTKEIQKKKDSAKRIP